MENYFNKYLESKLCLYKMVGQFITTHIPMDKFLNMNLEDENDYFKLGEYVEVCFHNFESDGMLAWKYLNIEKDYITHQEIWNLEYNLKYTKPDKDKNYYEQYLKICVLLVDMTIKYYGHTILLDDVLKNKIKYNEIDEYNNHISVCDNYCESAGESVWNLFDIENTIVGQSVFIEKRKKYVSELLENKEKTLVKK